MQPNPLHVVTEFFSTPTEPILSLLNNYIFDPTSILEPCAGSGGISKVLRKHFPKSEMKSLTQVEIRQEEALNLSQYGSVHIGDFLEWTPPADASFSCIITNPPFSKAQVIIQHCLKIAPKVPVIMLHRLGFLASQKRRDWINQNPPSDVLVLAKRPSFHPMGKRDITDYAWFVWNGAGKGVRSV